MTDYDDYTVEQRRFMWGWWGESWPSGICDDAELQKPTPVGEPCFWCKTLIQETDQGSDMPCMSMDGPPEIVHTHRECGLRQVLGPLKHQHMDCPGDGRCNEGGPETPEEMRAEALAVWAWNMTRGSR